MSASQDSPARQLPPKPDLGQLKNQARDLLNAHRDGAPEACQRFQASLQRLSKASNREILESKVSLRDAQSVLAREYGFSSWAKLKDHVEDLPARQGARQEILQAVSERPEDVGRALRAIQGDAQLVGPLLVALGQQTTAQMMRYLSDSGIELVTQAIAGLKQVTPKAQDRALEAFVQRLRGGEPVDQDSGDSEYRDFLQGALELAVGRPRAIKYLDRQGVPANRKSKPRLTKQYLAMKRGLKKRLQSTPSSGLDLEEIRDVMVKMADIARTEGILALEEYFDAPTKVEGLFCTGMRLAIDGTEPAQLADMLEIQKNAIVSSLDTRCKMITAGVMAIQEGVNPRVVDQKLASFSTTIESPPFGP